MLMQSKSDLVFLAIWDQTEQKSHMGLDCWAQDVGVKMSERLKNYLIELNKMIKQFKKVVLNIILESKG